MQVFALLAFHGGVKSLIGGDLAYQRSVGKRHRCPLESKKANSIQLFGGSSPFGAIKTGKSSSRLRFICIKDPLSQVTEVRDA